jgi:hypothetical protein
MRPILGLLNLEFNKKGKKFSCLKRFSNAKFHLLNNFESLGPKRIFLVDQDIGLFSSLNGIYLLKTAADLI